MNKNTKILFIAILCVLTGFCVWQGYSINKLRNEADESKISAVNGIESKYKDSIKYSNIRLRILQSKYDSLASFKKIVNVALKINKRQSDEKIFIIYSANDSVLHYIEDSTLRSNGFR